jgi:chemotaxis protein methyltransferase CheR
VKSDQSQDWPNEGPVFSTGQLHQLRHLVREHTGISISIEKDYLLINKLTRIMQNCQIPSPAALIKALEHPDQTMVHCLHRYITTNHTYFFREASHFQALTRFIKNKPSQQARIWCAASSTGEEVYSLLFSLLEEGIDNFLLLASDINLDVLKTCRRGIYHQDRLANVAMPIRTRYFNELSTKGTWQVKDELRKRIILKRLNLVDELRFVDTFHYIFCRNVLMYFDLHTQAQVVRHLCANLAPKGYLFLSHSEPLLKLNHGLVAAGASIYRKAG